MTTKPIYRINGTVFCMELEGENAGRIRAMTDVEQANYILETIFARPGTDTSEQEDNRDGH